jgi:hypothetical protein
MRFIDDVFLPDDSTSELFELRIFRMNLALIINDGELLPISVPRFISFGSSEEREHGWPSIFYTCLTFKYRL